MALIALYSDPTDTNKSNQSPQTDEVLPQPLTQQNAKLPLLNLFNLTEIVNIV